ncbi:hypothetical protein ACPV52_02650 [Vibrio astriarenae]
MIHYEIERIDAKTLLLNLFCPQGFVCAIHFDRVLLTPNFANAAVMLGEELVTLVPKSVFDEFQRFRKQEDALAQGADSFLNRLIELDARGAN